MTDEPCVELSVHGFFDHHDFVMVNKPFDIEIKNAASSLVHVHILSVAYQQPISTYELVDFPTTIFVRENVHTFSVLFRESAYNMFYNEGFYISVSIASGEYVNCIIRSTPFLVFDKVLHVGGYLIAADKNKLQHAEEQQNMFRLFRAFIEDQCQTHATVRSLLMEKVQALTEELNTWKLREVPKMTSHTLLL